MEPKSDIRLLDLSQLVTMVTAIGEKSFRAKQIWQWLWQKAAVSFEEMSNLPKELREHLNTHFVIRPIVLDKSQFSADGTIKCRFKLHDGHFIEAVLIPVPDDKRFTVCVSCQVGCSLTCKFCATGRMKRLRNLDPGEIVDQVVEINRKCLEIFDLPLTNIVYMGMGEPLLAYQSVMTSIAIITSPDGLGMSPRRITLSTAGIAKMIKKLADDGARCNLALSLHAPDDTKRNEIMPINENNNLEALMDALEYFYQKTGNRVTYEYIALNGFNDTLEDAAKLYGLTHRFPVKINIIEYNPIEDTEFSKSDDIVINQFVEYLARKSVNITLRRSRGKDIDAACGQLANKD
jgi:23S rRNA (adenine2503-C2)-methyltransferase